MPDLVVDGDRVVICYLDDADVLRVDAYSVAAPGALRPLAAVPRISVASVVSCSVAVGQRDGHAVAGVVWTEAGSADLSRAQVFFKDVDLPP